MKGLIGVYKTPTPERVEMDDEAWRTLIDILGHGGKSLGSFNSKTSDEDVARLIERIGEGR